MAPNWFHRLLGNPKEDDLVEHSTRATPSRHFRDLRTTQPNVTESQLLNANNRTPSKPTADVVVGGGGILGLVYAIHLKSTMPHLDIAVFEKSPSPQYKIGESTLSSFTRFLNTDVVGADYLLRLFGVKDGLDFIWVDEKGSQPLYQDIGNYDVSLQLDRRVSDLFLTMWAQKLGIRVYHGVGIAYDVEIPAEGEATDSVVREILLTDVGQSIDRGAAAPQSTIQARYVCDASGFSCRLTSKVGEKESFGAWNTDAVWAYYKALEYSPPDGRDDELVDWDYAATKHVCFPEGWGWFIKIISWHKAPLANLMDLLSYFIELAIQKTPMEEMPSTKELAKLFDCPFEFITSIGWSIRDDATKAPEVDGETDSERKFLAIQKKYPVLDRIMTQRYELLPRYYNNRTYFVRKQMSFRRPIVAGANWFAVGNAPGFTNPLISPGINAGLVGAVKSAEMTASCLKADGYADVSYSDRMRSQTRRVYQTFIHDYVMKRLDMMNRFWHASFRDGRFFEATIICYWAIAGNDRSYLSHRLSEHDFERLVGSGSTGFAHFYDEIMPLINGPCDGVAVDDALVAQVQTICRRWLDELVMTNPQPWSSNQRHYNDQLVRVPGRTKRTNGFYSLERCHCCMYWNTPTLPACQICGHKRDNQVSS